MALLTCQKAAFAYEGNVVVQDVSFEVNPGDYVCIVGENGSGKSTLMKGLLRLKEPVSGQVEMAEGLQKEIGYLPQQGAAQKDFPASVFEVVLSGRLNRLGLRPFYNRADKQIALENMHKLGIADLKKCCYRELSGGQQQRVLLARALCATQSILLLDEPTAGLDPVVAQAFYERIAQLNQEGMTILMVSHDIPSAVRYASHILHLRAKQAFFGTLDAYLASGVSKAFLGGLQND